MKLRRGMTLVELMMAFAILLAGMTTIFALLFAGTRSHRRALRETDAAQCAASVLADIRADMSRGVKLRSDGEKIFIPHPDFPGLSYQRTVISLEPKQQGRTIATADREYFVRVKVRWSEKGDDQSMEISTIVYRNADYESQRD